MVWYIHFYICNQRSCELNSCTWRGVLDITLCNKDCHWLVGRWLFMCSSVSSANKTDRVDRMGRFDCTLKPLKYWCWVFNALLSNMGAPAFIPDRVSSTCVLYTCSWNNTNISIKISYLQFSWLYTMFKERSVV
jgi:hypothetical protein